MGGGGVPEGCRRMVKSLKEVVSCPEAEIYAMLKDCNMDPNEAVYRLLSLDPFHEVKSKREKKKENKHTTEPKSRGTNNQSGRGGRDHYVGRSGAQFSFSESGTLHEKPPYKKENGSAIYGSHSSMSSGTLGNNAYHRPPVLSDSVTADVKARLADTVDGSWGSLPTSEFSQPSSWNQSVWGGVPGQVSMADIVKKGRPQTKASNTSNQSRSGAYLPQSTSSYHNVNFSEVSPDDEWPLVEPSTGISPAVQASLDWHNDASHLSSNTVVQDLEPRQEKVPAVEEAHVENIRAIHVRYTSEVNSSFDQDVDGNMESYQPHANAVEHWEVEDIGVSVSSVTSNLQQLRVVDEREALLEEKEASVIIPNHLQVQTADCSHLSFGSFGSLGNGPASSVPLSSRPSDSYIEEASADRNAPSVGHMDTRTCEYYGDESLRTGSDGNLVLRTGTSGATAYNSPSVSQLEVLNHKNHDRQHENHEGQHENQYDFPSSTIYSFENVSQLNGSLPPSQNRAQIQNFANQAYSNTLSSSLLGASAPATRESDYPYAPFAMGQSMPAKYGGAVSSVSSSTASMPEVLKAAGFSSTLQSPESLSGSNIATGPALPQHLMHQYSQVPFANMIGYPLLPQSYYLPGAYQQSFGSNNAYHQSLLPQYKNSVSVSSLPQSAAVASGYGGNFGSSTGLPGSNFSTNQQSPTGPTAVGYEDILSSQYKDMSHLLSLQQNENQATWVQGHGSRTLSGIPTNTYYSHQEQNHQQPPSGFRHNQQLASQNYGSHHANFNFYHSQSGILLDRHHHQQQQNPRDRSSLIGSQVQASKQHSQQLWQNSY